VPEERIEELIRQMTLPEKVSLLAGVDFWHTAGIPRLGVPSIKVTDGPHGDRTMADDDPNRTLPATCFPTAVAMGATWNTGLVRRVGMALGRETRARGCAVLLGPCVNVHRSPLGGRNFESFSEDPCLSAGLAAAYIEGVQSEGVYACVKHFALNNSEHERMTISSDADERAVREIYFPSFRKAVRDAGVGVVMCSYNKVNGTYASGNRWLLTDVLKNEWGFRGPVISDWFAVHDTEAAARGGLDLEMPGPARYFGSRLVSAVRDGRVEEWAIDDKVRRVLRMVFGSDVAGKAHGTPPEIPNVPAHRELAREVAAEAMVLLKNDGNILPLDVRGLRSIAVIGPNAASASIQGGGSSAVAPFYKVSPLEGLKNRCPGAVRIVHEPGCRNNILTMPLDAADLVCGKDMEEAGLSGAYFDNGDFEGEPAATKVDTGFSFRWFERGPLPGLAVSNFSARWTGYFKAGARGVHTFGIVCIGRTSVSIDGTVVCRSAGSRPEDAFARGQEKTGGIDLDAGKSYPITIEYSAASASKAPMAVLRVGCDPPLSPDLPERAAAAAAEADVAIVFAGLTDEYESEGFDRENMELPAPQKDLIKRVAEANPRTVVVLNNGSPLETESWASRVPAVLEAWYPGQEGGNAVAAVLCGDVNPSGRLPDTFPRRLQDNPAFSSYPGVNGRVRYEEGIFVGYRHYDKNGIEPSFPFGHGLSYTSFEYGNLVITPREGRPGGDIRVGVDITNSGERPGQEVVQLYVRDVRCRLPRPVKELKAFQKIDLAPGEKRTLSFTLGEDALSFFDPAAGRWAAEPGEFEIQVGASSRDIRARGSFILMEGRPG
jgi:beta-glucosidase